MIQVLITIVFVAELIIASAIILNIYKLDTKVLAFSVAVEKYRLNVKNDLRYFRFIMRVTRNRMKKIKIAVKHKQEEYTLKVLKTMLIYISLFTLKGKYKKVLLGYQFGKEIIEAIQEA